MRCICSNKSHNLILINFENCYLLRKHRIVVHVCISHTTYEYTNSVTRINN